MSEPCPDCGEASPMSAEADMHNDDCPRINSCGQIGPPWLAPPFHKWPDEISRDEYLDIAGHRARAHGETQEQTE